MTQTTAHVTTVALDAWTEARRSEVRLERLKVQVDAVQEAVATLHALLTEEIDYQQRAIAARSAPLDSEVRADYAALCERLEAVRAAYDALATGLDESIRRHAEHEIDAATFERVQRKAEDGLREHASELAALDELRARFLAVLDDEPVAADGTPAPPAGHEPAAVVQVVQVPPGASSSTLLIAPSAGSAPVPVKVPQAGASPVVVKERVPLADRVSGAQAVLVETHEASAGAAHPVSDGLHIGRAVENDLRVLDPSVSRQHALLAVNSGDFVIQDLHSQNGTFVNGERIGQRVLCDGDRITIGEAEFVFRTSRDRTPAPGRPAAGAADAKSSAQVS